MGECSVLLCCKHITGAEQSTATLSEAAPPRPAPLETKPRLLVLCRELQVLSQQWREVGEFLEVAEEELEKVESQSGPTPSKCMKDMLRAWLKREDPPPTWKAILEVVDFMEPELALKLKQKALA